MTFNIRDILSPQINFINPYIKVTWHQSDGYTTKPSGDRVPKYITHYNIPVQLQPVNEKDLRKIDGININAVLRAIYINEAVLSVVRPKTSGGDLIEFKPGAIPEGNLWLTDTILESWPKWRKVALVLQVDIK